MFACGWLNLKICWQFRWNQFIIRVVAAIIISAIVCFLFHFAFRWCVECKWTFCIKSFSQNSPKTIQIITSSSQHPNSTHADNDNAVVRLLNHNLCIAAQLCTKFKTGKFQFSRNILKEEEKKSVLFVLC